ncbi:MAG: DUF418 domain-containing protein [Leptospiraceae bacterium]|nr:DUF418 domain-containing protein [Leptospiraceae bacterium]MCZ8347070.1 DUF418 domain-containing protein [Leptospiraceae bacterium]
MSQIQSSHQESSSQTSAARLPLLDFLRGFSLVGILAVNLPYFAEPPYGFSPFHSTSSEVTRFLLNFFFTGKFFILFSFVFGYGFTILLYSSAQKGYEAKRVFYRRLIGLFTLGIIHAHFLFSGDILVSYSILGFILYQMKDLSDKTLIKCMGFFWILSILCYGIIGFLSYLPGESYGLDYESLTKESIANHFGTFYELTLQKIKEYYFSFPFLIFYNWPSAILMFLVGLMAGKRQLLSQPEKIWTYFQGKKRYLFIIAIISNLCYAFSSLNQDSLLYGVFFSSLLSIAGISLMILYILFWIRIFFLGSIKQNLFVTLLSRAGSMSLSNYLMQSIICNWIFHGWGLGYFGKLEPEWVAFLIVPIYGFNLAFSYFWKKFFALGPFEIILRKWTYG